MFELEKQSLTQTTTTIIIISALSFNIMMDFKVAFQKVIKLFLTLFIGAICVVYMLVKTLRKGPRIWFGKARNMPEDLMNPEYGIHRYIQLKDIKLHYVECRKRDKPLMLFLHGFPEFWYSWRHQIKAFKEDYWTVAVDMRGYGDSEKPAGIKSYNQHFLVEDVKNLIIALDHQSCVLVAHDWGGLVAFMFVHRYPEMVEKLILLNTCHPIAFETYISSSLKQLFKSWYMFFFQIPFLPEILFSAADLDKLYEGSKLNKSSITEKEIEGIKYTFSTPDMKLKKIEVPSLIIWGRDDFALETKLAQRSAEYFLNCKINYVEGAGHFVHQDVPSIVNKHMATFLMGDI